ncbi:MAG TPA: glucose-6-phosphate dehydrogenase [Anaerolineae bacterium]|nr:glucose-6-phosphate dehydrogenase [Anaerolineae bacterium]
MNAQNGAAPTIIIFGASGDLTKRKLVPALYNLFRKRRIAPETRIIGFARTEFSHEAFRQQMREGVQEFAGHFDDALWIAFSDNLYYVSGNPDALDDFKRLDALARELEAGQPAGRMYYLSTPPKLYAEIVAGLGQVGMQDESHGWRRIIIEKPFGRDLPSARELNHKVHAVFNEHQVYRIDHYLGKETVQNVSVFRFANAIFEPIWNRNYVDNVQISVLEQVPVGRRGGYYDSAGVFRDMFQNHILQLLTLIAMEPPAALNAEALRNEKVKVLSAIRPIASNVLRQHVVRAQYRSYRDEPNVAPRSDTPTYAALKLYVDNWRWQGVPFFLRSGKALDTRKTQIVVQFKCPPHSLFAMNEGQQLEPNTLAMEIQPNEGIHLSFQAKVPDAGLAMQPVNFDFHYASAFGNGAIPEAYERLILDALQGDASLFTRSDEIELSWALIDPIVQGFSGPGAPPLELYEQGSPGPVGADELLARHDFAWVM